MSEQDLRRQLLRFLDWRDAHVNFDAAVDGIPPNLRGRRPERAPYSPWELVEHMRLTQFDILDFCRNPNYEEPAWPDDYWPAGPMPPDQAAWDRSIASYRSDRDALKDLATQAALYEAIPNGNGQTYLRELLLVADHTSYHVGQLVLVRRLLGIWNGS